VYGFSTRYDLEVFSMGARGPTPKQRPLRRNQPKKPELAIVGELEVPKPPTGLLRDTRSWWFAFWRSQVAQAVQGDTDIQALERLAKLKDERERTYRVIRRLPDGPTDVGSQGQRVLHPLAKYLATTDAEIRALEDRFGLNPRARLSLGLQLTQARRSLEDLYGEIDRDEAPPLMEISDAGRDLAAPERKVHRSRERHR
jgi:P27 family predicted phage terminase small subunit